jgi:hypothetical protein
LRNVVTAVIALALSTLVAGMAAVWLAVETRAQEEFVLVFAAIAPLGLICALPMLVASYRPEPRAAVGRVARWLFVIFALLLAGLFGFAFYMAQTGGAVVEDLPLLAGIAIPALVILIVQWILFRWRARSSAGGSPPMRFGRIGDAR